MFLTFRIHVPVVGVALIILGFVPELYQKKKLII
jgi:hypothetical protein